MTQIPPTLIATSDPLDICEGLALLPGNVTLRLGRSVYLPLINKTKKLGKFGFSFAINVNTYIGACGPSYAVELEAAGDVAEDGRSLNLALSKSQLQAGTLFGDEEALGVEASLYLSKSINLKQNFDVKFSLLETVIDELLELLTGGTTELESVAKAIAGPVKNALSTLDAGGNDLAVSGRDSVKPSLTATIDVVSAVVDTVGEAFAIPELGELIKVLEEVSVEVSFGFILGLGFPTDVNLSGVTLSDGVGTSQYPIDKIQDGKLSASLGAGQRAIPNPKRLGLQLEHSVSLDFSFGLYFELGFVKIFKLGTTVTFSVLGLLEDSGAFSQPPFALLKGVHTVDNAIGSSSVARSPSPQTPLRPVEVRFLAPLEGVPT